MMTSRMTPWTFSELLQHVMHLANEANTMVRHHVYTLMQDDKLYYAPLGDKIGVSAAPSSPILSELKP
jgi:hypothetical protein